MNDFDDSRLPRHNSKVESRRFDDEFVVLDTETNRVHALGGSAAIVWQALEDGRRPDLPDSEVDDVVSRLAELGLLEDDHKGLSRRTLLVAGAAAGVALDGSDDSCAAGGSYGRERALDIHLPRLVHIHACCGTHGDVHDHRWWGWWRAGADTGQPRTPEDRRRRPDRDQRLDCQQHRHYSNSHNRRRMRRGCGPGWGHTRRDWGHRRVRPCSWW